MKTSESTFVAAARVRQALVEEGDIRGEIDFQNDINGILAGIEEGSSILEAAAAASEQPLVTAAAAARRAGLRLARGTHGRRAAGAREGASPYVSLSVLPARRS